MIWILENLETGQHAAEQFDDFDAACARAARLNSAGGCATGYLGTYIVSPRDPEPNPTVNPQES